MQRIEVTPLGTTAAPASERAPTRALKASQVQRSKKERAGKRHKRALSKRGKRGKKRSRSGARHG